MAFLYTPHAPHRWTWVTLTGPDAQDLLHRITTVDVKRLAEGEGRPGFILTAQGKVRAQFTLWSYGPGEYAFEFDAGEDGSWKAQLLAAIDQFTFAEKIALAPVDALECRWIFAEAPEQLAEGATVAIEPGIRLCHHGSPDFGRPWITAWGQAEVLEEWLGILRPPGTAVGFEQLEEWRIAALRPRPGAELTPETVPLEVGLRDAIAIDKGCYPGQEVIERIAALGSPARRLVRIEGEGAPPAGGEKAFNLADPPAEIGAVTSVSVRESGFSALAIVRKLHAKEGLDVAFAGGARGRVTAVAPYV